MNPTNRNLNDSVSYTAVSFEEDQDYTADNNDIKDIDDKDNISVCFKSNLLTFECTFATTMNQTNIKTHYNDAGTTQVAKRARTAEEQDNIQPHSSTMDIIHTSHNPLSDITNVRAINAAVASENHLEEEEQEHDSEVEDSDMNDDNEDTKIRLMTSSEKFTIFRSKQFDKWKKDRSNGYKGWFGVFKQTNTN